MAITYSQKTIVIIEPDPVIAQELQDILEDDRYKVLYYHTSDDARKILTTGTIHLLICNMNLNDTNTTEYIESIRQSAWGQLLPIILMSKDNLSDELKDVMIEHYGLMDVLDIPVNAEQIRYAAKLAIHSSLLLRRNVTGQWGLSPSLSRPLLNIVQGADSNYELEAQEIDNEINEKPEQALYSGELESNPFPKVVGHIVNKGLDGALFVQRARVKKIIYFQGGNPFYVKSNMVNECLGKILVSQKLISQEECDESFEYMKQSDEKQGQILVRMGSLSMGNLEVGLMLQMETKLFDVFSWDAGVYRFNSQAQLPPHIAQLDWKGVGILYEGVRRHYTEEKLKDELRPLLHTPMYLVERSQEKLLDLDLDKATDKFISEVKGQTLQELLEMFPDTKLEAMRLLYSLLAAQIINPKLKADQ